MTEWKKWGIGQKFFVIVLMMVLVYIGFHFYSGGADSAASVTSAAGPVKPFQPKQQVMPDEAKAQPLAVLRDPFVVPRGAASVGSPTGTRTVVREPSSQGASETGTGKTAADSAGRVAASDSPVLRLTGIVSAGDTKVSIIAYGSESRSYHRHEHVGPYEIVAIDERSVTLSGPKGQKVLLLGKAEP